jgi:hypothetical protein
LLPSSFCILHLTQSSVTLHEKVPSPDQQPLFNLTCEYMNVCSRTFCNCRLLTTVLTNELNSVSSVTHNKLTGVSKGVQIQ